MTQEALTYDGAVEEYLDCARLNCSEAIPQQPNRSLSKLKGTIWLLQNVSGPLAAVGRDGDVDLGRGPDDEPPTVGDDDIMSEPERSARGYCLPFSSYGSRRAEDFGFYLRRQAEVESAIAKVVREETNVATLAARIRYKAKKVNLVANKSRKTDLWYFADQDNFLISTEQGLDSEEAWEFITWKERQ